MLLFLNHKFHKVKKHKLEHILVGPIYNFLQRYKNVETTNIIIIILSQQITFLL